MAERGQGIAWIPEFMARDLLDKGSLVPLFDGKYGKPYEMFVLYASRTFIPAKTRVVIEFMKEKLIGNLDLSKRATH